LKLLVNYGRIMNDDMEWSGCSSIEPLDNSLELSIYTSRHYGVRVDHRRDEHAERVRAHEAWAWAGITAVRLRKFVNNNE